MWVLEYLEKASIRKDISKTTPGDRIFNPNVRGAEVLAVVSGKGGVGKTTFAVALAAALALCNKKVVVLELDVGLRNMDIILGINVTHNLSQIIENKGHWSALITPSPYIENLFCLCASQIKTQSTIPPDRFRELILEMKPFFDYIILDSPAGIDHGFKLATDNSDENFVIATPENVSLQCAAKVIKLLNKKSKEKNSFILNKAIREFMNGRDGATKKEAICTVGLPIDLVIPFHREIQGASHRQQSVFFVKGPHPVKSFFIEYVCSHFGISKESLREDPVPTGESLTLLRKIKNIFTKKKDPETVKLGTKVSRPKITGSANTKDIWVPDGLANTVQTSQNNNKQQTIYTYPQGETSMPANIQSNNEIENSTSDQFLQDMQNSLANPVVRQPVFKKTKKLLRREIIL